MRTHCLYRFFDIDDNLLYVGITGSMQNRTSQHRATKPWWDFVATMKVQRFATRYESEVAERVAIRDENPVFNASRPDPDAYVCVKVCWVCGEPVVDFVEPGDMQPLDHLRCSEVVIDAYEKGLRSGRSGG